MRKNLSKRKESLGFIGHILISTILCMLIFLRNSYAAEITEELTTKMSLAGTENLIPVNIRMKDTVEKATLQNLTLGLKRKEKRSIVCERLKEKAFSTQALLLSSLKKMEKIGRAKDIKSLWITNIVSTKVTKDMIENISSMPEVERIDFDEERNMLLDTAWGVTKIRADKVWSDLKFTGEGVVVAVLDTGIDYNHSDLKNNMWKNTGEIPNNNIDDDGNGYIDDYYGYNFYGNKSDPLDDHGHGTHVSGTIAGDGSGGIQTGVAPGAHLMACKVLSGSGFGTESDAWESIQYAVDNGADVMNLSIGVQHSWGPDRKSWREACDKAIVAGVVMVVAAGNDRKYWQIIGGLPAPDNINTPGDVPSVITVGATDSNDNIAYFSSY